MTGENSLYLMLSTTHMWEMSGFLLLFLNVCMHGARAFDMLIYSGIWNGMQDCNLLKQSFLSDQHWPLTTRFTSVGSSTVQCQAMPVSHHHG